MNHPPIEPLPAPDTGRISALDVLTPAGSPEPDDALTPLLAVDTHAATDHDRDQLAELHRWMRERREAKARYEALASPIRARTQELLERRVERDWWPTMPATVSDQGEPLKPFVKATMWPKFRTDPDTGERYSRHDVTPALEDAGLAHLVTSSYDATAFAAVIREQVRSWRARVSETPATNTAGDPVDAYGEVLTAAEREDPTADDLGVHPALRDYVTVVELEEIGFTKG